MDSFEIEMQRSLTMVQLYAALLDHLPRAFQQLLVLRSFLVKPFGLAGVTYRELTSGIDVDRDYVAGDKLGRWTLHLVAADELIAGENDKHLDFRVSVCRDQVDGIGRATISTAVMVHNGLGRAYLSTILPFHRHGVAQLLANAAHAQRL